MFHNRLTHTLEVAQIGRRIAERLVEQDHAKAERLGGIDPDVVETAAMVHDLGHPPYGHAVEKKLDRLVRKYGVPDGYEGNAQSFRIVTNLSMRRRRFPGLDLTRASLNATLKYPWPRSEEQEDEKKHDKWVKKHDKWGYYRTETQVFQWVRQEHPGQQGRRSIEAEIMDWSDDVAYAVHDVEDFYRAGLIPLDRLRNERDYERSQFCRYAAERLEEREERVEEALQQVLGSSPVVGSYSGTNELRQQLRTFTAGLINSYATAVDLADDLGAEELLDVPPDLRLQVDVLKQLTWLYIIDNRSLKTQQHGQQRVVEDLFDIYMTASVSDVADVRGILPDSQQEQLAEASDHEEQVRLIADLISSMTEQQLMMTHRKLTGIELGSITDLI